MDFVYIESANCLLEYVRVSNLSSVLVQFVNSVQLNYRSSEVIYDSVGIYKPEQNHTTKNAFVMKTNIRFFEYRSNNCV